MAGRRKRRGGPRSARQRAALRKAQMVSAQRRKKPNKVKTVAKAAGVVIATGLAGKASYYAFHPNGFRGFKSDLKDAKAGYAAVKGWLGKGPKSTNVAMPSSATRKNFNPYHVRAKHTGVKRRPNRLGM